MTDPDPIPPSYDRAFYQALEDGVQRSAEIASGLLWEMFRPESVIDVGCGTGQWLAALQAKGARAVCGVDGPWVPRDMLVIEPEAFVAHDLTRPLALEGRFDLALCLEAAEHLPESAAEGLVDSLVRLAPVVVFSAAVPGQGGHGHLNERWPHYWRDLFAGHGYLCSTALRDRLWQAEGVEPWYRQNLLCFAEPAQAERLASLPPAEPLLDVVHPVIFGWACEEAAAQSLRARQLEAELAGLRGDLDALSAELQGLRASSRRPQ